MEFLTAPGNLPFSIALAVVFLLGLLEALALLLGGVSGLFNVDAPDVDIEAPDAVAVDGAEAPGVDVDGDGGLVGGLLQWLHVGQLPTTVLLLLFLLSFGIGGLVLQWMLMSRFGALLPATLASVPALAIALLGTRLTGSLLKPVLPRDETEAVSLDSLVGCGGQITVGTARHGRPAEARVKDRFGHAHYVMVEPDGSEEFPAGSHVLLIKRHGAIYQVIDNAGANIEDL